MGGIVLFSVCFFPVLSAFVYIYLDILKIACSHHKQIFQIRQAGSRTADNNGHQHFQHHPQHHQVRNRYWSHVKALQTVAMLVGCFLVLWCPFFVVSVVQLLCESCKLINVLENYVWLMGLTNSLINPLVYAYWQREVRLQLAAMFTCCSGSPLAPGPQGVTERCDPQTHVQSHGNVGDPSPLRPDTYNEEVHARSCIVTTGV